MAKYTVTHRCGHESVLSLVGKTSDREWRIQSAETKLCTECWQAEREKERQDASRQAAIINFETGCAPLVGTEKRVLWAETIRFARLDALHGLIAAAEAHAPKDAGIAEALSVLKETKDWARAITDAQWWIDNKDAYSEVTAEDQIGYMLAIFGGRSKPKSYTGGELAKQILILSPYMTIQAAEKMGLKEAWTAALEKTAKAAVEKEARVAEHRWRDEARALGISGSVKVWSSEDGDHRRVYGDGFTWHHTGRDAGKLENKTVVESDALREFCKKLCNAWKRNSFYA